LDRRSSGLLSGFRLVLFFFVSVGLLFNCEFSVCLDRQSAGWLLDPKRLGFPAGSALACLRPVTQKVG